MGRFSDDRDFLGAYRRPLEFFVISYAFYKLLIFDNRSTC